MAGISWQNEDKRRHSETRMPLSFLMRLLHVRLPIHVANPEDIRHVSVLLATGLIEAEIQALESTVRYATSRVATVLRITEAGFTELAKMGDARFREEGTG
ncbi:hypothetical protein V9L21_18260 [Variovorax sp. CCNWLW235]|jgi:hypothetical protein